jgi:hypothetical protein
MFRNVLSALQQQEVQEPSTTNCNMQKSDYSYSSKWSAVILRKSDSLNPATGDSESKMAPL